MKSTKNFKRIVVKVGSSVLTEGKTHIIEANLERIVKHVADLSSRGKEVVLVSSGAIASGLSLLGMDKRPTKLSELQAAAAIGQNILMHNYTLSFAKYNLKCAQLLLTREDFNERKRFLNVKNTILDLFKIKVIPIVNENDTVSVDEIKFGDNDMLSALVAMLIEADGLEILSDAAGLCQAYDKEKKKYIGSLRNVDSITPEIIKMACGTDSATATGGMKSKIDAIKIATNTGISVVLTNGLSEEGLKIDFVNSNNCSGTYFKAASNLNASRKHWIAFSAKVEGRIIVDDGAAKAILNKAASLLSPGVTSVQGIFSVKDVVDIIDKNGSILARGITNYSSQQLEKIMGKKSEKEVMHRNNLVLLK